MKEEVDQTTPLPAKYHLVFGDGNCLNGSVDRDTQAYRQLRVDSNTRVTAGSHFQVSFPYLGRVSIVLKGGFFRILV